MNGSAEASISLNGTSVGFSYPFSSDKSTLIKQLIAYAKSLSSLEEPKTWKEDSALAAKFNLGGDPCSMIPMTSQPLEIKYEDIQAGLRHRNETIRGAAAIKAGAVNPEYKKEVFEKLKILVKNDPSVNVRADAVAGLAKMAETDPTLIPLLIDVMQHDKSRTVGRAVSRKFSHLKIDLLEPYIPSFITLLEDKNPETRDLGVVCGRVQG